MLCLTGEVGWARLSPAADRRGRRRDADRAVPARARATPGSAARRRPTRRRARLEATLSDARARVLETLRTRGASFFDDLAAHCALDDGRVRAALGELVAAGLVTSDGFAGLRALIARRAGRPRRPRRRLRRPLVARSARDAGADVDARPPSRRRRGRCSAATASCSAGCSRARRNAAPWRELARVYRRLEARGEIRGGRFVSRHVGRAVRAAATRSSGCARSAARRPTAASSPSAPPIRSTSPASSRAGDRIRAVAAQPHRLPRRRAAGRDGGRFRPSALAHRSGDRRRRGPRARSPPGAAGTSVPLKLASVSNPLVASGFSRGPRRAFVRAGVEAGPWRF